MSIKDEIYQLIVSRYLMGREVEGLSTGTNLIETGVLDSFMLVGLLSHLERQYGVKFGDDEIVPENFESISRLAQVIELKMTT
uniref:Acyl carrier protein n=1 Tax=Candidatus Kentrum sp. UNK TaxID=2126344 RepID=A0A451B3J9_9GAMM|nr:MAG: Acyl carrier protein [Candidatus Kentron sp. UNK]VFK72836.1 MAG: Acyl carrier protein [Candidatus Kentron sp. UNK]